MPGRDKRLVGAAEELDRRETQCGVADIFQIMGHAFTGGESEMRRVADLIFHVRDPAVAVTRTRPPGGCRRPEIVLNMGVKSEPLARGEF